ncbi:YfkD family protein [Siminovitchia sediminis]|uniref:YfkD family protein n=1 Tax=Siminovitchia sediminis TaxID=1274353 RepID=A0ABW4KJI6_9BACI
MKRHFIYLKAMIVMMLLFLPAATAAEKSREKGVEVPSSVVDISKDNTFSNPTPDLPRLQPSSFAKELLESSKVKIENPQLIRMLNESAATKSPLAFGTRATIFLGEWPLNYQSEETTPNWQFQKINTNFYDNRGGTGNYQIHYVQEAQKNIKGGLSVKLEQAEEVQQMILQKAYDKVKLPLAFETVVGGGTKHHQVYNIPPTRTGYLYAYASAVHEKGSLTYGEVFLVMKGSNYKILVKNVTSQEIGAWIPIQDHISFSFETRE